MFYRYCLIVFSVVGVGFCHDVNAQQADLPAASTQAQPVSLPANSLPPAPEKAQLPLSNKGVAPTVFEWLDYGGRHSTASAKVTAQDAADWCDNWQPGKKDCAQQTFKSENSQIYSISANCFTGELQSEDGGKYLFGGAVTDDTFWNKIAGMGFLGMIDAKTGKRVPMDEASGGGILAHQWLMLCPLGTPYNMQPPEQSAFSNGGSGTVLGYEGSTLSLDDHQNTIRFSQPKPSLQGVVAPNAIWFRGWIIRDGSISGVAYSFQKGCNPAPYLVDGYDQYPDKYVLQGKLPIRSGCDVTGYTDSVRITLEKHPPATQQGATLTFDHNGSLVSIDSHRGLITYQKPKRSIAGTIHPGDILFQGVPWDEQKGKQVVSGTAFVFKSGCAPAPYQVQGQYDPSIPGYVMSGKAPLRDKNDCGVMGYSADSANARLVFSVASQSRPVRASVRKSATETYVDEVYETESDPNWLSGFTDK